MHSKKSRFVLTASQQNGILLFAGVLFIISISKVYYDRQLKNTPSVYMGVDSLAQQKIDSLKILKEKEQSPPYVQKIYPFNPNFLKEGKAYRLGISAEEFDRLMAYRSSGKWINSVDDFKRVTRMDKERLSKISPYFKFPEWVTAQQNRNTYKSKIDKAEVDKKDINVALASDLEQINGIGQKLSGRIIRYRKKIGGFRSMLQLKDVYGLNHEVLQKLSSQYSLISEDKPKPIDINNASLIELADVPYFDYELAREVFQFIKVNEGIEAFEELSKLQHFPSSKIDRIKLYLTIIE